MALGVDIIRGDAVDVQADTVTGSLAKAIKDKVDSYANDATDVIAMNSWRMGGYVYVMILHV